MIFKENFIKAFWLCFLFPFSLLSQNDQKHVLSSIEYEGLKSTKVEYLQNFLDTRVGEIVDLRMLEEDVQRIQNLAAISKADFELDTISNAISLTLKIEEASTLFPIVNFGGVSNNFWFQLGFNDTHWLGKGIHFSGYYANIDGRHNGNIFFKFPFLLGKKWGFSGSALRYASTEPLFFNGQGVFFDYTNSNFALSGIYQINRRQSLELGGTFFVEDYQKDERHAEETTPGPEELTQPKVLGKILHRLDKINYHFFYVFGFDNSSNFQTVYNLDDQSVFNIFLNETRYFKRVGLKGNLAVRFRLGVSTNTDSPFAPFVIDSQFNIRGSGNRIDRGTGAMILNLEYRQTIFERKRFAIQAVGFSDIGNWRSPGGELSELSRFVNYRHFAGGGFRFINKKAFNSMLRVDFGMDLFNANERGFVLGAGQYF